MVLFLIAQMIIALILCKLFLKLIASSIPYASDASKFEMKCTPHQGMDMYVIL